MLPRATTFPVAMAWPLSLYLATSEGGCRAFRVDALAVQLPSTRKLLAVRFQARRSRIGRHCPDSMEVPVKNPQLVSPRFRMPTDPRHLQYSALFNSPTSSALSLVHSMPVELIMAQSPLQLLEKKDDKGGPSFFSGILKFLKFKPAEIERMEKFVGAVGKLAATVSWVVGAVTTVKALLEFTGVLDKDDEAEKLQQDIALKVDAIYRYLQATEKKDQFELAVKWRSEVQRIRNSIANLALSRSASNLDTLGTASGNLMREAINPMLAVPMGDIPFIRSTYGGYPSPHTFENQTPDHWTDYALPLWMGTTGNEPVSLTLSADLAAGIWDPGYYLDVLIEAVGVRLTTLAAVEPAFRSTGYDRTDLWSIHNGLSAFISRWEKCLFKTMIIGPLAPEADSYGDHRIYHPWIGTPEGFHSAAMEFGNPPALPLGAVDPVSGVVAFDAFWREGLQLHFNALQNYWVVRNYDQAVSAAYAAQSVMLALVWEQCGLRRVRELRDSVYALIGPPSGGSEFVILSDPSFTRDDITGRTSGGLTVAAAEEEVDLGEIGGFAGKPGKKYKAKRVLQYTVKRFRVPMARRMDVSKIQLGYRLRFVVGHGDGYVSPPAIDVNAVLTDYSAASHPTEVLPLFPTESQVHDLQSDTAAVYDVLQSDVFSAKEEDLFESTGTVPGKHRLYLNRRRGKVAARVQIAFELDTRHPDHPFVGFANVAVGSLHAGNQPNTGSQLNGFILHLDVYEKRVAAPIDPPRDEIREDLVASMNVHLAPSFLVVDPEYFKDREACLAALGAAVESIDKRYRRAKARLGPLEPIMQIDRVAQEQKLIVDTYQELLARRPEVAQRLEDTFAVPMLRQR
jgi:hypothetical protein